MQMCGFTAACTIQAYIQPAEGTDCANQWPSRHELRVETGHYTLEARLRESAAAATQRLQ